MNNGTNAYHRFLLKHRVYCELCAAPIPATKVTQIKFKNVCVCDAHWRAHNPIQAGLTTK